MDRTAKCGNIYRYEKNEDTSFLFFVILSTDLPQFSSLNYVPWNCLWCPARTDPDGAVMMYLQTANVPSAIRGGRSRTYMESSISKHSWRVQINKNLYGKRKLHVLYR